MPIEGFDYKGFAASMSEQAKELVPQELEDREKEYIVKTLGNFTLLAGEALYNDQQLNLNAEQAVFITQIIAEWSFHKSIDLIHSGILPQYWDSIMQKIAFTIFEVAKQAVIRKIPQDQLLQAVEHHVIKVYNQSIEELQQKGLIDEETKRIAVQPCAQDTPNAATFYNKEKKSNALSVRWNGRDLLNTIQGIMHWDLSKCGYRVDGVLLKEDQAMLFDLTQASELK